MTPISTLYYQWVVTEEDKKEPTIFENIEELDDAAKVNDLLNAYAAGVADLIEAEVNHRALIEGFVQKAAADPELAEATDDEIAQGITELEPVQESEAVTEAAKNALDMLHDNLVAVFSGEE
jgi:hypothetical protein